MKKQVKKVEAKRALTILSGIDTNRQIENFLQSNDVSRKIINTLKQLSKAIIKLLDNTISNVDFSSMTQEDKINYFKKLKEKNLIPSFNNEHNYSEIYLSNDDLEFSKYIDFNNEEFMDNLEFEDNRGFLPEIIIEKPEINEIKLNAIEAESEVKFKKDVNTELNLDTYYNAIKQANSKDSVFYF